MATSRGRRALRNRTAIGDALLGSGPTTIPGSPAGALKDGLTAMEEQGVHHRAASIVSGRQSVNGGSEPDKRRAGPFLTEGPDVLSPRRPLALAQSS